MAGRAATSPPKLHARCDGQRRPLGFVPTQDQAHDVQAGAVVERTFSRLKN